MSFVLRMAIKYSGLNLLGSRVLYQRLLTAHAFVMIFFSIIPIPIGALGNLLFPVLPSKIDIDMPRWNAFSL